MRANWVSERANPLARHAVALLGFSIPISVALDNTLLALVAVLWLAGGDLRGKLATIASNPVALAALALFGMLIAGLSYGIRYPGDGIHYLSKYIDLLFIPIFVTLFQDARTREIALRWFCVAMVLTFVFAEFVSIGMLDENAVLPRAPTFPGAFRHSTTHGLLCVYAAFLFALWAFREKRWQYRALYTVLVLVAIKNILFVAVSRTGYALLALLALYFFFITLRERVRWAAILVLVSLLAGVYVGSPTVNMRVNMVADEILEWRTSVPSEFSSVGLRLEWYQMSLAIIREHPVLGAGTGSPPRIYAERAQGIRTLQIHNPHSEYLLLAVQTGLIGLALLIHLFWQQLRLAARLATPVEGHLARAVVFSVALGCLFNSFLLDHTEGLFFAWFTGVLYGGLRPQPPTGGGKA